LNDPGTRLLRISDILSGRRGAGGSFTSVGYALTRQGGVSLGSMPQP